MQISGNLEGLSDEQKRALIEHEVYQTNMGLMQQIIGQMKEIPVLPSEIPPENDKNALIKVEFPDEGGVLTFMEGYELPYRGFPYFEIVEKIDVIKKINKGLLSGLFHSFRSKNKLWLILLLPTVFLLRSALTAVAYTSYRLIERFRIKHLRLCQAMRELHTAFTNAEELPELRLMLRDLLCNTLEFDNAYRFRAQDLIEVMHKGRLAQNPVKELNRILTVAQSRETTQEIKDTWKLAKMFVNYYLRFDRKLLRMIQQVLLNVDVEKFKLTPEDKQFCAKRKDYTFGSI